MKTVAEDTNLNFKKLEMFEQLVDDRIDALGLYNTIAYLIDNGFTKEELIEMNFDKEAVEYVFENPEADYDYR